MDVDTDTDTDSQEHSKRFNFNVFKNLKHVYEPYFRRLFRTKGFIRTMDLRYRNPNDSTSYILLCEAIKRNDNENAQALIHHYCQQNIDSPDPGKDIPLHLATLAGNIEIVELLLSKGARARASFQDQREPLHLICDKGTSSLPNEQKRLTIGKLLIQYGANVNAVDRARKDTPLILAARNKYFGLTKFLLANGSDRHYANHYGETALHAAFSQNASNDMILLLYDKGFDLQQTDANECTVFIYAVRNLMNAGFDSFCNMREAVRAILFLLKQGVSINSQVDRRGNRLLHMISQNSAATTMKIFLDHGADVNARNSDGKTALHFCAEHQTIDVVELLIEYGADVYALTNNGQSVLHFAAANKNPRVLEELLRFRLDIDSKGKDGNFTPLFNAVWSNCYDNAKVLLEWKAKVNERIINSQTVLHIAVDQKHTSCVELLLEYDSDVNISDDYGNTPLTISLYQIAEMANSDWWDNDAEEVKPTENVQRSLTKHTARMFFMGQHLSEQSLKIMNNSNFRDFYADCIRELSLMRESKLFGDLTFFEVLTKQRKLLTYCRHEEFSTAFKDSQYKERFPIYCDNLNRKVEAATEKLELLDKSSYSLIKLVQKVNTSWADAYLPALIVDNVLSYLDLSDLRNLSLMYSLSDCLLLS